MNDHPEMTVMEEFVFLCVCMRVCVYDEGESQRQPQSQIWECGNETEGWQANKV